jgi:hypothetical protein
MHFPTLARHYGLNCFEFEKVLADRCGKLTGRGKKGSGLAEVCLRQGQRRRTESLFG